MLGPVNGGSLRSAILQLCTVQASALESSARPAAVAVPIIVARVVPLTLVTSRPPSRQDGGRAAGQPLNASAELPAARGHGRNPPLAVPAVTRASAAASIAPHDSAP